jgi:hypothetical protein
MALADFWTWLESSNIAMRIAESWWFPLLESVHVLGVAAVVGAVLMADLRLLGIAARSYALERFTKELVAWSWIGFVVAVITGVGLFSTRASHYAANVAFQFKIVLLLLAGANMTVFQFAFSRTKERFLGSAVPTAGRIAGILSLILWAGVVLAGRWTGHLS